MIGYSERSRGVNFADIQQGSTPLHLASGMGHTEIVDILLGHGACHPDERDSRGLSAMHYAVYWGCAEVARMVQTIRSTCSFTFVNICTLFYY